MVDKNTITNSGGFGVFDEALESTNLVISNRIWNPSSQGLSVNYPSGPAPEQFGSLTGGLPTTLNGLENLVVQKEGLTRSAKEVKMRKSKAHTYCLLKNALVFGKLHKCNMGENIFNSR